MQRGIYLQTEEPVGHTNLMQYSATTYLFQWNRQLCVNSPSQLPEQRSLGHPYYGVTN